jgi:hypothetical protein
MDFRIILQNLSFSYRFIKWRFFFNYNETITMKRLAIMMFKAKAIVTRAANPMARFRHCNV